MKRRDFFKKTALAGAALSAAGVCTDLAQSDSTESFVDDKKKVPLVPPEHRPKMARHPVRLGAPVFHSQEDPEAFVQAHKALGYRAAYCPRVSLGQTDRVKAFRDAFRQNDIMIAEVGRWCNLMDRDEKKKKANLARVIDGLALAEEIGARCCVDIAGSFNPDVWYGPHPKNLSKEFFDAAVENAQSIIDAVKPKKAKFAYEMMGWALPDSVDSYLDMIRAVDRKQFGVHLDPCNLVNSPRRFYDNTKLINDCFDRLGPWIVSCHAKDLKWEVEMNVHFREVVLGEGSLNYKTYLQRLATLDHDVPLMMEHLKGKEQYETSRKYLHKTGREVRVFFEYL